MITIKSGAYTPNEIRILRTMLSEIHSETIVARICDENECETCEIRHLCGDILRAKEHSNRLVAENQKNGKF